jgi:3-demethoxyubiquinol 3-hydroxylase
MDHPSNGMDRAILVFDRALKTLFGPVASARPSPGVAVPEAELAADERRHAAGLMRVNHTGEVCAQALYEGQALVARKPDVRVWLESAAREETDHLAWCESRLSELDSRPSVLNPLFYGASMGIGVMTGLLGDRISLGFVEATEDQVSAHLTDHLSSLPVQDARSRAIVEAMQHDEEKHGMTARAKGGQAFAPPVRRLMRLLSRVMTAITYRL